MLFSIIINVFLILYPSDINNSFDRIVSIDADFFDVSGTIEHAQVVHEHLPRRIDWNSYGILTTAPSALVVDKRTGTLLWSKNPDEKRPIASITKLMATLVFLDSKIPFDMKTIYTKEDEADDENKFKNFYVGEELTVEDVFYLALLPSDNNAINILIRLSGMSKEKFVQTMNEKAVSFGMLNTRFVDPAGLSDESISTAKDVALLAMKAFSIPEIQEATTTSDHTITILNDPKNNKKTRRIYNTNLLLSSFLDVVGGKTGHTEKAGYCLVSSLSVSEDPIDGVIIVVLGAKDTENRFMEVKGLGEWVTRTYSWKYD